MKSGFNTLGRVYKALGLLVLGFAACAVAVGLAAMVVALVGVPLDAPVARETPVAVAPTPPRIDGGVITVRLDPQGAIPPANLKVAALVETVNTIAREIGEEADQKTVPEQIMLGMPKDDLAMAILKGQQSRVGMVLVYVNEDDGGARWKPLPAVFIPVEDL
jgi:hypothetical protein